MAPQNKRQYETEATCARRYASDCATRHRERLPTPLITILLHTFVTIITLALAAVIFIKYRGPRNEPLVIGIERYAELHPDTWASAELTLVFLAAALAVNAVIGAGTFIMTLVRIMRPLIAIGFATLAVVYVIAYYPDHAPSTLSPQIKRLAYALKSELDKYAILGY